MVYKVFVFDTITITFASGITLPQPSHTIKRKPYSLSLQPLTAFAEIRFARRDFAKTEGRKTEKGKVGRVAEGGGGWVKNILKSQNGVTWREGPKSRNRLLK